MSTDNLISGDQFEVYQQSLSYYDTITKTLNPVVTYDPFVSPDGKTHNKTKQWGLELSFPCAGPFGVMPPVWFLWKKYRTFNAVCDAIADLRVEWGETIQWRVVKINYTEDVHEGFVIIPMELSDDTQTTRRTNFLNQKTTRK